MLRLAGGDDTTISEDDFELENVIADQTVLGGEVRDTTNVSKTSSHLGLFSSDAPAPKSRTTDTNSR